MCLLEVCHFFKTFGEVTNVAMHEAKQACTVHFKETSQAEAAAQASPVMGDPKIEIHYNVGGQKVEPPQPSPAEEEKRAKLAEMKAKIEAKR